MSGFSLTAGGREERSWEGEKKREIKEEKIWYYLYFTQNLQIINITVISILCVIIYMNFHSSLR